MAQSRDSASSGPPRRNLLAGFAAIVIGGVISAFSFVTGVIVFADPLTRKKKSPKFYRKDESEFGAGYVKVGSLDAIPADGVPRRFPVIDDLIDAWNFTPNAPIGSVYIRREEGSESVSVLHTTCPHAGCSVSYSHNADAERRSFHCPCHNSAFTLEGGKMDVGGAENPSPRDMDELDAQVDSNGDVWVKYEDYYTGIHEKKAKL